MLLHSLLLLLLFSAYVALFLDYETGGGAASYAPLFVPAYRCRSFAAFPLSLSLSLSLWLVRLSSYGIPCECPYRGASSTGRCCARCKPRTPRIGALVSVNRNEGISRRGAPLRWLADVG